MKSMVAKSLLCALLISVAPSCAMNSAVVGNGAAVAPAEAITLKQFDELYPHSFTTGDKVKAACSSAANSKAAGYAYSVLAAPFNYTLGLRANTVKQWQKNVFGVAAYYGLYKLGEYVNHRLNIHPLDRAKNIGTDLFRFLTERGRTNTLHYKLYRLSKYVGYGEQLFGYRSQ